MKYTISLDFPICQKCTAIQALFTKYTNKASLWAIPFGVLGLAVVILLGIQSSSSDSGGYICGGVFAGFILWAIAMAIITPILTRNFPQTLKERNKRITGAASISAFNQANVTFKFKNKSYATSFQLLNTVDGLNLLQQIRESLNKKTTT